MTDEDLLAKKLALIETYVRELRTLSKPREISTEVRERRFAGACLDDDFQGRQVPGGID